MNTIKITTTQNVQLDYAVAGVAERMLAALLDYLFLLAYIFGMFFLLGLLNLTDSGAANILIIGLPAICYDLFFELFVGGQSLGKKVLKIKVVKLDGSQPDIGSFLLRWLLRLIEGLTTFGTVAMVTIIVTGKGQRLGDLAAGTTVIRIKETVSFEDTIFAEVEENYNPVFSQIMSLTDEDMSVVKDVINNRIENSKVANHLADKAKVAVETKTGIKSDMLPAQFLETVLKDFNYYVGK